MSFGIPVRNGLAIGLLASTALSSRSGRNSVASLILNFTDGIYRALGMNYNFSDLITFTRSTTATFVGSNGLIQTAAINAPRFDYNPVTLVPNGLLIEEQRINLLRYSEQFNDVNWVSSNTTVTANTTTSPDGLVTADTLVEAATTGTHTLQQQITGSSGVSYTASIFAKANTRSQVALEIYTGATIYRVIVDLTNGSFLSSVGTGSYAVTAFGNGWYRISATAVSTSTAINAFLYTASGNSISYAGNGVSGVYIWGAQLEAAAFATSYIPTVASTVTRAADVAVMTGTNFSSWYNQTEGTLFAQALTFNSGTGKYPWSVHNGTGTELIAPYFLNANGGGFVVDGTTQAQIETAGLATLSNIALAVKLNDFAMSINGNPVGTDNAGTMPTPNQMQIGNRADGARTLNGHIRQITYYPSRLTNAQLQALTA